MAVQDADAAKRDLPARLAALLAKCKVARVLRADDKELAIEFDDGTRLFARAGADGLDISIT